MIKTVISYPLIDHKKENIEFLESIRNIRKDIKSLFKFYIKQKFNIYKDFYKIVNEFNILAENLYNNQILNEFSKIVKFQIHLIPNITFVQITRQLEKLTLNNIKIPVIENWNIEHTNLKTILTIQSYQGNEFKIDMKIRGRLKEAFNNNKVDLNKIYFKENCGIIYFDFLIQN